MDGLTPGEVKMNRRLRIPKGLFIAIAIVLLLGLIAGPIIQRFASEKQMNTNVLLSAAALYPDLRRHHPHVYRRDRDGCQPAE